MLPGPKGVVGESWKIMFVSRKVSIFMASSKALFPY